MKLHVPYYSQFVDIEDSFWMLRACGAVSLKMVAEFFDKTTPTIVELCEEARTREGYHSTNGWVHDYLVTKATELGLSSHRAEGLTDFSLLKESLDNGNPVIVSVEKRVLEQTRFHLLVLVGYEEGLIFYHEPESTDKERGQYRSCSAQVFMNYWRGKAIFVTQ